MASLEGGDLLLSDICRCCMASKPRMKPLFESNLHKMLRGLTGLQLHKNDGLPAQLCVPCVLQIRRAHYFKELCEQTDSALRNYVSEAKGSETLEYDFSFTPTKTRIKQESDEGTDEPEREKKYACSQCPKAFELERKLKRHLRIHMNQKPHHCPECDMAFVDKSNLNKHMRKHTGELRNLVEKPHLCSECGKSFKYSTSLSRHRRYHAKRNLFTCHICSKSYVEQLTLDVHMRSHTNEKPFACPTCDKCFAQKINLDRHERTHTGEKPFSCDICGNCFTQKSYLVIHKRIHTQEKPYECRNCSAAFISRNALHKHERTPCSVKPYRCNICKKTFRYKKCLRTHRRNHMLESPHACKVCDARFLRAIKLIAHMKLKHPDVSFDAEEYNAISENLRAELKPANDPSYWEAEKRQRRQVVEQAAAAESDFEGVSEVESDDEERIKIENEMYYEDDGEGSGQRLHQLEVIQMMYNGDTEQEAEVFEEQEYLAEQYIVDTTVIKQEPLLAIKIMDSGEDDSDIEQ